MFHNINENNSNSNSISNNNNTTKHISGGATRLTRPRLFSTA